MIKTTLKKILGIILIIIGIFGLFLPLIPGILLILLGLVLLDGKRFDRYLKKFKNKINPKN